MSIQKVIYTKEKYVDSIKKLQNFSKGTNGYNKVKREIAPLLKEINGYGYFHTKREKHILSYYELNEAENIIKNSLIVFASIVIVVFLGWLFFNGMGPWLLLFGFMFWLLGKF